MMSSSTRRRTAWVATATLSAASLLAICGVSARDGRRTGTLASRPPYPPRSRPRRPTGEYAQRFLAQYNKIKDPANGYFSPEGIPYHSVETLIVEAPDHGHETTSEAYSYWLWLEAHVRPGHRRLGPVQQRLGHRWRSTSSRRTPTSRRTRSTTPSKPGDVRARVRPPEQYPSQLDSGVTVGQRPARRRAEVAPTAPTDIYGMHWLLDVDNIYGFGTRPAGARPARQHRPVLHQHLPARPAGVGLGDRPAAVLRRRSSTAARTATWTCSPRTPSLRQAVEVHQRPGRRRARRRRPPTGR